MSDANDGPKIHIDSDWKNEAQEEKERIAEETTQSAPTPKLGEPGFVHLINALSMPAIAGLGAMRGPGGEVIPPDPEQARFYIDMLGLLEGKTKGNLTDEESKTLTGVLHELRSMYVNMISAAATPSDSTGGES